MGLYFMCHAICVSAGSKRASKHPEEFELASEEQSSDMTEEQRAYLRWFYRTQDRKYCCCCSNTSSHRHVVRNPSHHRKRIRPVCQGGSEVPDNSASRFMIRER